MNKVSELISKMRKLRSEATQGEWSSLGEEGEIHAIEFTDQGGDPLHLIDGEVTKLEDAEFICAAANHTETLLKIIEVQDKTLKEIAVLNNIGPYEAIRGCNMAKEALAEAERLAGGIE
jgi:hypothetical protein